MAEGTIRYALKTPNFGIFWVAQAISRFGDPITLIALASITYAETSSALYTSLAVVVATVPRATFGFFAGAIADSIGHRRAMVACDLSRAVLIAAVPLAIELSGSLALAYVLVFVAALFSAMFNPARFSVIPSIVPPARLAASNSVVYATDRTVEILGALAGGVLVATVGVLAFYVDAVTFAVSGLLLARLSIREGPPIRLSLSGVWSDTRTGLRFIRDVKLLRDNTVFSLLAQLSLPIFNGLLPALIFRRFAQGDVDVGGAEFGLAEAALAAGAVIGAVTLARVGGRIRKGTMLIGGFIACGAAIVLSSAAPTLEILLVCLVGTGIANVAFYVPNVSIAQELAPAAVRARVFGARIALLSLSWLPITLAAGALADRFPVALLIGVAGAFTMLVALAATQIEALSEVP